MTRPTPAIRPYRPSDRDDLYDVCVRTADAGGDARGTYADDELMGDLFAATTPPSNPASPSCSTTGPAPWATSSGQRTPRVSSSGTAPSGS
ncbi:hypothetical protein NKG05_29685 [Oerskovia sp. M15]